MQQTLDTGRPGNIDVGEPTLQQEPQAMMVYETSDVEEADAQVFPEPEEYVTDNIDGDAIPRQVALQAFVTAPELSSGANLDARIASIAQQIASLQIDSNDGRLKDLQLELRSKAASLGHSKQAQQNQASLEERPEHKEDLGPSIKRIATLEARLASVEARVGYTDMPAPLVDTLKDTGRKLDLLSQNPAQLSQAVKNLQGLQQAVERSHGPDKITRIYESLRSLDPVISSLPAIAARLKSLQVVHSEAAYCQEAVKDMDATVRSMAADIAKWLEKLDVLNHKVDEAVKTSSENRAAVEKTLATT